jgi:hypothetical protein
MPSKYYCTYCDYDAKTKSSLTRHEKTKKHIKKTEMQQSIENDQSETTETNHDSIHHHGINLDDELTIEMMDIIGKLDKNKYLSYVSDFSEDHQRVNEDFKKVMYQLTLAITEGITKYSILESTFRLTRLVNSISVAKRKIDALENEIHDHKMVSACELNILYKFIRTVDPDFSKLHSFIDSYKKQTCENDTYNS